jgi:hypothetical protein
MKTTLGTVTENADGTLDVTIDSDKLHEHCMAQAQGVLADLDAAEKSGMFPKALLDGLRKAGQQQVKRMEAAHAALPKSTAKLTLKK